MDMLSYYHVDVFAPHPFTGNSLAVFPRTRELDPRQMLAITQEMRHFETIFLEPTDTPRVVKARVFDMFEELDFAGHPLLGAAAMAHHQDDDDNDIVWTFQLPRRDVTVVSTRYENHYRCILDQGAPEFLGHPTEDLTRRICSALNLTEANLYPGLPLEVVSTGLRYLIVPVKDVLAKARIIIEDFGQLLAEAGAQFVYVLDVDLLEGRHWNNDGKLEDVATGSAAGTVGAYLARHGIVSMGEEFVLHQGQYTGRPSEIYVRPTGVGRSIERVLVGGDVSFVADCTLMAAPPETEA